MATTIELPRIRLIEANDKHVGVSNQMLAPNRPAIGTKCVDCERYDKRTRWPNCDRTLHQAVMYHLYVLFIIYIEHRPRAIE